MELLKHAAYEKRAPDPAALLAAIPFCRHMGISATVVQGALTLVMPYQPLLIGNPVLPALHGGAIGAFLETAAIAQVAWELGGTELPKTIDISIDYLRTGRAVESSASARIAKRGRRVVNVHA
ncbi:MAG TPA: PaaI family thioesterase, partial [Rhizomicrobium sp.]|nr:PaaI family thioesterase [Rhizomicrobium sp.]